MTSSALIVIPCYNEAARLPINDFKSFVCKSTTQRFILVNDGSTDATLERLQDLVNFAPERFRLCNLPKNVGKAEATRTGILIAIDSGADYVGYWDADLATPLETIKIFSDLLDAESQLEMVFGARVGLLGRLVERSAVRHYAGRIFATAASLVLKVSIYDTQCGAKLFRTSPALLQLFEEPFLTRWLFDIEIVARLIQSRHGTILPHAEEVIYEYPLDQWRDVAGSKLKLRDFLKAVIGLGVIFWHYRQSTSASPGRLVKGLPINATSESLESKTITKVGSR